MFVLKRERFYTVYIYFKETLFFNFSYKLFKKYFFASQSTCCQFRVAARKLTKIAMCMYVEILVTKKLYISNYRFLWKSRVLIVLFQLYGT